MSRKYGKFTATTGPECLLQLMPMRQLTEAVDRDDDWTGITDSRTRRKIQTRLNTRAYRKRLKSQHNAFGEGSCSNQGSTFIQAEQEIPCWFEEQQTVSVLPTSVANSLYTKGSPVIHSQCTATSDPPNRGRIIFPLAPDHLIVLLQYNVLRACKANRDLLLNSGLFDANVLRECDSSVIHTLAPLSSPASLPYTLHPTVLQCTIPHEDWIDLMPHPIWRDNLIRAAGTYDEDSLWSDCIGGLFDGFPADEIERRGILAWSPTWNLSGWEISEGFKKKWGWLFKGTEDIVLEATNRWRRERGEEEMVWEVELENPYNANTVPPLCEYV